jgi:hypothetical protein
MATDLSSFLTSRLLNSSQLLHPLNRAVCTSFLLNNKPLNGR